MRAAGPKEGEGRAQRFGELMLLASLQGGTLRDGAQAHPVVYNKGWGELLKKISGFVAFSLMT